MTNLRVQITGNTTGIDTNKVLRPTIQLVGDVLGKLNFSGEWTITFDRQKKDRTPKRFVLQRLDGEYVRARTKPKDNSTCWDIIIKPPKRYDLEKVFDKLQTIDPEKLELIEPAPAPKVVSQQPKELPLQPKEEEVLPPEKPEEPKEEEFFLVLEECGYGVSDKRATMNALVAIAFAMDDAGIVERKIGIRSIEHELKCSHKDAISLLERLASVQFIDKSLVDNESGCIIQKKGKEFLKNIPMPSSVRDRLFTAFVPPTSTTVVDEPVISNQMLDKVEKNLAELTPKTQKLDSLRRQLEEVPEVIEVERSKRSDKEAALIGYKTLEERLKKQLDELIQKKGVVEKEIEVIDEELSAYEQEQDNLRKQFDDLKKEIREMLT